MSKIIPIRVDDNLTFFVEVEDADFNVESGAQDSHRLPPGAKPTGRITDSIEKMSNTVLAVVKYIRDGFVRANHPDELEVEFSVTLKGTSGIPVVASGSTEGTFKISAKWKNKSEDNK
jgi:hypothetical protein